MSKSTLIFVVLLAVVLLALAYWSLSASIAVEAARVSRGPIAEFVDEQGITRLPKEYLVTMPYDGRLEPIALVEGQLIEQGAVVAQVVPIDLELEVAEAEAAVDRLAASIRENEDITVESTTLQQAARYVESMDHTVEAAVERVRSGQARLEFANTQLSRFRTLAERNATTEERLNEVELAQVEAQVDYQQDQLVLSALRSMQAATALVPTLVQQYMERKQLTTAVLEEEKTEAEKRLAQQQQARDRGIMRSPITGVVLEHLDTNNERSVATGTVLARIGQLDELEVEADILSQDVVAVQAGDRVDIYGPAIGLEPVKGSVKRIYPAGFTKTSSLGVEQQRVKVVIEIAADDRQRLRQERELGVDYRVRVRIYTAENPSAVVVPRSALFRGPTGNWQVFAVRGGRAKLETVPVGLMNDELAEVTGGLEPGDLVILAPETSLTDSARVEPIVSEASSSPALLDNGD